MRLSIVVSSVPHYYAARFAALQGLEVDFQVLSVDGVGDFDEFIDRKLLKNLPLVDLSIYGGASLDPSPVRRALEIRAPDVVIVAGWASRSSLEAIRWAVNAKRPVVLMSESQRQDGKRRKSLEYVKSKVVALCDAALVGGRSHKEYLVELGMQSGKIFLGYNAVDNRYFADGADVARRNEYRLRKTLNLPPRYLLASARFIEKKNLTTLVAAYGSAILGVRDPPKLVILGDGPERHRVEEEIIRHDLGELVQLRGFQPYSQLPSFYGLADGFIHISLTEQWGLVINEAASSALPLIVSQSCGAAYELVVEPHNGILVDPHRVGEISGAINSMICMTNEARKAMGSSSQQLVELWGPERFASGLLASCQCALRRPPRKHACIANAMLRALSSITIRGVS